MAVLAGHVDVFAGQRETRLAVIEAGFLPVDLGVAVCAFLAQAALVLVVLVVAGVTARWSLAIFLAGHVAVTALHLRFGVGVLERKLRQPVVEGFRIKRGDVHAAPLVLGMAAPAVLLFQPPVVAPPRLHVARDLLVAVEAQSFLGGLVEARVTLLAIGLDLGVTR